MNRTKSRPLPADADSALMKQARSGMQHYLEYLKSDEGPLPADSPDFEPAVREAWSQLTVYPPFED